MNNSLLDNRSRLKFTKELIFICNIIPLMKIEKDQKRVQEIIPLSDPMMFDSKALRVAARNGHADYVKWLIPVSDPKALCSEALRDAAWHGHTECVKLLIPVSDPKAYASEALRWSIFNKHPACTELLIPVSDPEIVEEFKANGLIKESEKGN